MVDAPSAPATAQATPADPKATQPLDPKSQQGSAQSGTGGATGDLTKDAAAEAMRKYKLKIEGREVEVDEEELKRGYSHQRAANKILQEGRAAKKQAEEFVSMMRDKQKLFDAIKRLGHDPRKLSEEFLASQLEEEMLDPKEKELRDTRNRLKSYEEREAQQKEAEQRRQNDELKAKYTKEFSEKFVEALKETNLQPTNAMVAAMAGYIARAAKINMPMTPLEAAKLVQQDEDARIEHRFKSATPEQIIQILKEEGLQKVRAYDTSRLRDPNANLKTPPDQGEKTRTRETAPKRLSHSEWRRHKMGL